jgi:oligopeptide/dipeptide ABC transporter ATP-binding protein
MHEQGTNGGGPVLSVRKLSKTYRLIDAVLRSRSLPAVDGVTFDVRRGETFGIVGESGSGKTTIGKLLLKLTPPTSGDIVLDGIQVGAMPERRFRQLRGRIQMVFQDPLSAFDPLRTVVDSVGETMRLSPKQPRDRTLAAEELLEEVGLSPALGHRYPSQLSGGQLQRASIARALAPGPDIVFLDEPTSALDVSIRAQVANVLRDRQEQRRVAYVLVAHDWQVVAFLANRIAVMYLGEFVEAGSRQQCLSRPLHPYTRALMTSAGRSDSSERVRLRGELTPQHGIGCRLVGRCPFAQPACAEPQQLVEYEPGHWARCRRVPELIASPEAFVISGGNPTVGPL